MANRYELLQFGTWKFRVVDKQSQMYAGFGELCNPSVLTTYSKEVADICMMALNKKEKLEGCKYCNGIRDGTIEWVSSEWKYCPSCGEPMDMESIIKCLEMSNATRDRSDSKTRPIQRPNVGEAQ